MKTPFKVLCYKFLISDHGNTEDTYSVCHHMNSEIQKFIFFLHVFQMNSDSNLAV